MKPSKLPAVTSLLFPRTIDELFNQFWDGAAGHSGTGDWTPPVDVEETEDAYLVRAELPGIDVADVEVTIDGDRLTFAGEKKSETETDDARGHVVERTFGRFSRSFTLPAPVAADAVEATAKNGVLTIRVRKAEAEKKRRIEIKDE